MNNSIKVWKTIKLGTGMTSYDDFMKAVGEKDFPQNFKLLAYAEKMLKSPSLTYQKNETSIDLAITSLRELGLVDGVSLQEIFTAAEKIGLVPCPAEVGPQLRLQYLDQPEDKDNSVIVAAEPIVIQEDKWGEHRPCLFFVGKNSIGQYYFMNGIDGDFENISDMWREEYGQKWVFAIKK